MSFIKNKILRYSVPFITFVSILFFMVRPKPASAILPRNPTPSLQIDSNHTFQPSSDQLGMSRATPKKNRFYSTVVATARNIKQSIASTVTVPSKHTKEKAINALAKNYIPMLVFDTKDSHRLDSEFYKHYEKIVIDKANTGNGNFNCEPIPITEKNKDTYLPRTILPDKTNLGGYNYLNFPTAIISEPFFKGAVELYKRAEKVDQVLMGREITLLTEIYKAGERVSYPQLCVLLEDVSNQTLMDPEISEEYKNEYKKSFEKHHIFLAALGAKGVEGGTVELPSCFHQLVHAFLVYTTKAFESKKIITPDLATSESIMQGASVTRSSNSRTFDQKQADLNKSKHNRLNNQGFFISDNMIDIDGNQILSEERTKLYPNNFKAEAAKQILNRPVNETRAIYENNPIRLLKDLKPEHWSNVVQKSDLKRAYRFNEDVLKAIDEFKEQMDQNVTITMDKLESILKE